MHVKQEPFWSHRAREREEGERQQDGTREERERVKLAASLPAPREYLSISVIAISRKVPFALNRADGGKKKKNRLCNLQDLCKKMANNNTRTVSFCSSSPCYFLHSGIRMEHRAWLCSLPQPHCPARAFPMPSPAISLLYYSFSLMFFN